VSAKVTVSKAPTPDTAVVFSKNHNPALLKGAMGAQDFNKRTTATKPMRGGRSLGKGGR
jgi:hypothetical protein